MAEETGFEPASLAANRFQGGFLTTRTSSIANRLLKSQHHFYKLRLQKRCLIGNPFFFIKFRNTHSTHDKIIKASINA